MELPHKPNSKPKTARLSQKRHFCLGKGGKLWGAAPCRAVKNIGCNQLGLEWERVQDT